MRVMSVAEGSSRACKGRLSLGGRERRTWAKVIACACFYVWLFLERCEGGKRRNCWSLPFHQLGNCSPPYPSVYLLISVLALGRSLPTCRPWPKSSLLVATSFGNPARSGFSLF